MVSHTDKMNSPATVSEQFFHHLQQQEYDKANTPGTEHTQKLINANQTLSEMGGGINLIRDK
jgi:hypothetical protein